MKELLSFITKDRSLSCITVVCEVVCGQFANATRLRSRNAGLRAFPKQTPGSLTPTPASNHGARAVKHFAVTNSRGGFRYCYSLRATVNNAPVPSDGPMSVRRG